MTGKTQGKARAAEGLPLEPIDADSADRIDVHLKRASYADDVDEANFHVRHARQLLEACKTE
jgi:hypothetical protein